MKLHTIIVSESSLSRVTGKMGNHAIGMITAFRGEYTRRENMQRNVSLRSKLLNAGMQVTPVKGEFIENFGTDNAKPVRENTLFVVNPKEGDDNGALETLLRSLGEEFEQDSIFTKPFGQSGRVVGTTKRAGVEPAHGDGFDLPDYHPGKTAEFMTRVRNRPFTFEGFGDTMLPPDHNMGRWPLSILAKKDWREVTLNEADEKSLEDDEKVVDSK